MANAGTCPALAAALEVDPMTDETAGDGHRKGEGNKGVGDGIMESDLLYQRLVAIAKSVTWCVQSPTPKQAI